MQEETKEARVSRSVDAIDTPQVDLYRLYIDESKVK